MFIIFTLFYRGRYSSCFREASMIIEQSPAALQLRYLQTLNSISSGLKKNVPRLKKKYSPVKKDKNISSYGHQKYLYGQQWRSLYSLTCWSVIILLRKELDDSFPGADGHDLCLWWEGERRVIGFFLFFCSIHILSSSLVFTLLPSTYCHLLSQWNLCAVTFSKIYNQYFQSLSRTLGQ